ncbi:MAG: DNA topoisomerase [Oscillospiraceae bacterium]
MKALRLRAWAVGLITYMRTDSLRISDEARAEANAYITEKYGEKYLPPSPRVYKSKSNSQDAHEAIRPTMPSLSPEKVKESLTNDQFKLYRLIWERFLASQMANALFNTVSAEIGANDYLFKASGYSVKFDGYTVLYEESKDEDGEENGALPPLEPEEKLRLKSLDGTQHFTQPPARYTEASLIKTLEENGIGRPHLCADDHDDPRARLYRTGRQVLRPTLLGEVTTGLMKEHFSNIVDAEFTAKMEKDLDKVEEGKLSWVKALDHFYGDFAGTLERAEKAMEGTKPLIPDEETDIVCEKCGRNMVIKLGVSVSFWPVRAFRVPEHKTHRAGNPG